MRVSKLGRAGLSLALCTALVAGGAARADLYAEKARPASKPVGRPFTAASYLNTPLAPNARVDAQSRTMVEQIRDQVRRHGAWVVNGCYSTPVWIVKRGQPRVAVTPTRDDPSLRIQWASVPLPKRATGACGTDGHLTVWQPSTDTLWEFYRFERRNGRAHAAYGGRIVGVSLNPGYFLDPPGRRYGATATSIPLLAGLQRISEIRAGRIDHAVAFGMANPAPCYRWPAQRRDHRANVSTNVLAPPEGARLRLPAGLNLRRLHLTAYGLRLARAVQRYGMVLRDRLGKTAGFYAEKPHGGGPDPYGKVFGRKRWSQRTVLRNFPWDRLQVLAPRPGESGCAGKPGPPGPPLPPLLGL